MDEAGTTKEAIWVNGTVCRVSDGTWLFNERSNKRCHPKGEAAAILFDAVPSINYCLFGLKEIIFVPNVVVNSSNCIGQYVCVRDFHCPKESA